MDYSQDLWLLMDSDFLKWLHDLGVPVQNISRGEALVLLRKWKDEEQR